MCCRYYDGLARTARHTASALFLLSGCWAYAAPSTAGELIELALSYERGVYQLNLEMVLYAPADDVRYVLTDYVHIYRINPSIVESEILNAPDESVVRVRTLLNDCILIFCREILRVEDVQELETGDIHAVVVPQLSNIKSGTSRWQIRPMGSRTRLEYTMELEPGFFVPPLIGVYLVKQKLREELLISLKNIERIARIRSEDQRPSNLGKP